MNRIIFPCCLLVVALFFSCKKDDDPVHTDDVRITSSVFSNTGVSFNMEYDAQGRVTKITSKQPGMPDALMATVTYNGNVIDIIQAPVATAGVHFNYLIRYTTDAAKRPLQRIETVRGEYFPPNQPQRDFDNDTTTYEYNTGGQLTRTVQVENDSTWFNPGVVQHILQHTRTVKNYTYNNGNLAAVTSLGNRTTRNVTGATTTTTNHILEDNFTYDYSSGFPNKTDFSNALVLSELQVVFFSPYFMNPAATLIPNRSTRQEALKDITGAVISSSNSSLDYTATYNSYGFLSNLGRPAVSGSNREIIYNR